MGSPRKSKMASFGNVAKTVSSTYPTRTANISYVCSVCRCVSIDRTPAQGYSTLYGLSNLFNKLWALSFCNRVENWFNKNMSGLTCAGICIWIISHAEGRWNIKGDMLSSPRRYRFEFDIKCFKRLRRGR